MLAKLFQAGLLWNASQGTQYPHGLASFGVPSIDESLPEGGLRLGCIHEWCLSHELSEHQRGFWSAPLLLLASILSHNIEQQTLSKEKVIVWVGRRCWPSPGLLNTIFTSSHFCWKTQCLFINPPKMKQRLWSACEVIRSGAASAVVVDGGDFDFTASRRIQLHAEQKDILCCLVRPPWKIEQNSSAHTKWHVQPQASSSSAPQWNVKLLRCRGTPEQQRWTLECSLLHLQHTAVGFRENSYRNLLTDVGERPPNTKRSAA